MIECVAEWESRNTKDSVLETANAAFPFRTTSTFSAEWTRLELKPCQDIFLLGSPLSHFLTKSMENLVVVRTVLCEFKSSSVESFTTENYLLWVLLTPATEENFTHCFGSKTNQKQYKYFHTLFWYILYPDLQEGKTQPITFSITKFHFTVS